MTDAIRKVHDYLSICAPHPFQEALVTALNFPRTYYDKLAEMYDKKRRQLLKSLDEAEIEYHRPEGAYYVLANAPEKYKDGQDFAEHLLKDAGVAVLPANALYHNKQLGQRKIRFAFCKKDATLQDVGRRLKKLSAKSKQKVAPKA